jgi:hypothetical protein
VKRPRHQDKDESTVPVRTRVPRAPLPSHEPPPTSDAATNGLSHDDLVDALRSMDDLQEVGRERFHFRSREFLHFHAGDRGNYADVRFGTGDFEPVWASTPTERAELLARVYDHVERVGRRGKTGHQMPRQ